MPMLLIYLIDSAVHISRRIQSVKTWTAAMSTMTWDASIISQLLCRYIPFFGLATWLLVDGGSLSKGLRSGFWDSHEEKP